MKNRGGPWLAVFGALLCVAAGGAQKRGDWVLDDFQDGDRIAASGLGWMTLADDMIGGTSWARVSPERNGLRRGDRALQVRGHVAKGSFAGAWVGLDGKGRSTDIRAFTGLRLRVRGTGEVLAGFRGGPKAGSNFMRRFPVGPKWATVEIPFSSLEPVVKGTEFDAGDVRFMGVQVAADREGPFEFWIDDVSLYGAAAAGAAPIAKEGPTFVERLQAPLADLRAQGGWQELARDPVGDGTKPGLPDAVLLKLLRDDAHDQLWFRVEVKEPLNEVWAGMNLALDLDGDPNNGTPWWGHNKAFRFDRLVTAYVNDVGSGYQGQLGIADAADIANRVFDVPRLGTPGYGLDRANRAVVVAVPRTALEGRGPIRLVAAVGSSFMHNDDVPDEGAITVER